MSEPETEAILEAVRAVLELDGELHAATGRLRRVAELGEAVDQSLLREQRVEYEIKSMRLRRSDGETATVDLDAILRSSATGADGAVGRGTSRARGPVQLVREADGWKVVDLIVDDVSLVGGLFENGAEGSRGGLTVTILGGRVVPQRVWLYVRMSNDTGAPLKVERVAFGQRRSLRPGWRWATATLAADSIEPGTTTVDAAAELRNAHAARPVRLLVDTDEGVVDARPDTVRRPRRRVPLSARYPSAKAIVLTTAVVAALGALFGWWIAGLVLVQVCGLGLLAFQGLRHKQAQTRGVFALLALTLAGFVLGVVLFFANGGLDPIHTSRDERRAERYVEHLIGRDVDADKIAERRVAGCDYTVWRIRPSPFPFYVVSTPTTVALADSRDSPDEAVAVARRHNREVPSPRC